MSDAFVSINDLTMAFGDVQAVKNVSFSVMRGEHLTLLGPSGCGKTTTLRAIAGLETPQGGQISIEGVVAFDRQRRINLPPERRGLAMVFQSYAIWPHMTVFENVWFAFRVRGVSREKARAHVEKALALVDLADYGDRPASKLSGGQQQRVALARALAHESKVILFDEPLSNLDAQLRASMRDELVDLRARLGFTAIYVTHDQEEAFSLSDRVVVMRAGEIEQEGRPAELHAAPRTEFMARFLGVKNIYRILGATPQGEGVAANIANGVTLVAPRRPEGSLDAVALCFRPNSVRLTLERTEGQGGQGVVRRRLFQGDQTHYTIDCNGIDICAFDRLRLELVEGSEVFWRVEPTDCLLLGK